MFELFKRVKTVVAAELHAMVDKAENPVHLMDQYLREMNQEVSEAERATAKMIAEERLLGKKIVNQKELLDMRQSQAVEALQTQKEDLAKKVIEDKMRLQKELVQLEELHTMTLQHVVDLKEKLSVMKSEYREMELKRNTLAARAQAAQAKSSINQALSTSNSEGAKSGFARMEEKVAREEANAQAWEELNGGNRSLEEELKEWTLENEVEAELNKLKSMIKEEKQSS
ncbi:PspA/IM30 family protein [Falsibacillus pallidus]|uniref:Phage shock protein A (PspA) family protein n=1 Tax=Falsibacillus pallidus TaxID=493781 RepID=A0A370GEP4_9BACI|nr:PspA/IM30 family protein [Falsibacillus pallidus]RDI42278.1 phage shock protein A (PspA) family protein [Falsibacillus pallidus]